MKGKKSINQFDLQYTILPPPSFLSLVPVSFKQNHRESVRYFTERIYLTMYKAKDFDSNIVDTFQELENKPPTHFILIILISYADHILVIQYICTDYALNLIRKQYIQRYLTCLLILLLKIKIKNKKKIFNNNHYYYSCNIKTKFYIYLAYTTTTKKGPNGVTTSA